MTKDEAIELACKVFPEYEKEIKGNNIIKNSSRETKEYKFGELIIIETRKSNTGEMLTYQQYDKGEVIVTFFYDNTIVDSSFGTGYAYRKCDLEMYCNVSNEILKVKGLEYTHVHNGYDSIATYGSTSQSTATVRYVIGNTQETSTMKAFVAYHVSFTSNLQDFTGEFNAYLLIEIGDDTFSYMAVGE